MGTPKPLSQSKRVRSRKNHGKRIKGCQFLWVLSILLVGITFLIVIRNNSNNKTDPSKIEKSTETYHDFTIDKSTITSITLTPEEGVPLKMNLAVNDIDRGKEKVTVGLRKLLGGIEDVNNEGKTNRENGENQQIIVPGTNSDTSDLYYLQQLYTARATTQEACLVCTRIHQKPAILPIPWSSNQKDLNFTCLMMAMVIQNDERIWEDCSAVTIKTPYKPPQMNRLAPSVQFPDCFERKGNVEVGRIPNLKCLKILDSSSSNTISVINFGMTITAELPDLKDGTFPIADIFWYCGDTLLSHLSPDWSGLCAPVMLLSTTRVIVIYNKESKRKRSLLPKDNVYINWAGIPKNIPHEYKAMSDSSINSLLTFLPWVQGKRNAQWINYLYYNQQRFLNATTTALKTLGEQLHATSKMALENRLVLDTILADERGVCAMVGSECCTVIPFHTGPKGNFTIALERLQELRNELYSNSIEGQEELSWWNWLLSGQWKAVLTRIFVVIVIVLIVLMGLSCCIVPLIHRTIKKLIRPIVSQYTVVSQEEKVDLEKIIEKKEEQDTSLDYYEYGIGEELGTGINDMLSTAPEYDIVAPDDVYEDVNQFPVEVAQQVNVVHQTHLGQGEGGQYVVVVEQIGPDSYINDRGQPCNSKGGPLNCPFGNPLCEYGVQAGAGWACWKYNPTMRKLLQDPEFWTKHYGPSLNL